MQLCTSTVCVSVQPDPGPRGVARSMEMESLQSAACADCPPSCPVSTGTTYFCSPPPPVLHRHNAFVLIAVEYLPVRTTSHWPIIHLPAPLTLVCQLMLSFFLVLSWFLLLAVNVTEVCLDSEENKENKETKEL